MRILKRIEECVRAPCLVLLRESIKVKCEKVQTGKGFSKGKCGSGLPFSLL